jgi:hypothetical protein
VDTRDGVGRRIDLGLAQGHVRRQSHRPRREHAVHFAGGVWVAVDLARRVGVGRGVGASTRVRDRAIATAGQRENQGPQKREKQETERVTVHARCDLPGAENEMEWIKLILLAIMNYCNWFL